MVLSRQGTVLKLKGPFTSEDIDYFGTKEVARNVARALGGELFSPQPGDHTPSTAQIETTIHGKKPKIDFLGAVLGIHNYELQRGVSVLEITAELDGKPTKVLIKVLHPLICLKSRIVSMLHPATRRTDRIARAQAEAALVIMRRFIDDALNEPGGWKEARECFRRLYRDLRSDQYVKVADIKLGVDPLTILAAFGDDERIDKRYRENQMRKMIARVEGRRAGRHNRSRN